MAGTLFGLPLSQQLDADGDPLIGALLYLFEAGTSTPVISYSESGLITAQGNPLVADSSGRIPQFWLDDGTYRARLTTALGVEVFDEDGILALGPSTSGSGGGSGSSVDATAVSGTGDMKWRPIAGALAGWVRANARTIGSASSGGTERANADTQTLYEFLWNNFSDTLCPVVLGRGASSISDFNANKAIATLDMRGRSTFGLDDMGNSAAAVIAGGTPTTAGSSGGGETATILQANLPNVTLTSTITNYLSGDPETIDSTGTGATAVTNPGSAAVSVPLGGSGTALNKMPPYRLGSWYIKL